MEPCVWLPVACSLAGEAYLCFLPTPRWGLKIPSLSQPVSEALALGPHYCSSC
jgi:hypothetical protein